MLEDFLETNLTIYASINDGKRLKIETASLKRQRLILGTIFVVALGTVTLAAMPATIPAITTFFETTLATYLPGVTLAELGAGIADISVNLGLLGMMNRFFSRD